MSLRTRVAFILVLLLIGGFFAAPHYKTATATAKSDEQQELSTPTLQIQRKAQSQLPPLPSVDSGWGESGVAAEIPDLSGVSLPSTNVPSFFRQETSLFQQRAALKPVSMSDPDVPSHSTNDAQSSAGPFRNGNGVFPVDVLKPVNAPQPANLPQAFNSTRRLVPNRVDSPTPNRVIQPQHRPNRQLGPFDNTSRTSTRLTSTTTSGTDIKRIIPQRDTSFAGTSQPVQRQRSSATTPTQWHRIVNGDSLESLALEYFGDANYALQIFAANRTSLASPAILPIGTELRIPQRQSEVPISIQPTPVQAPPISRFNPGHSGWVPVKKDIERLTGL